MATITLNLPPALVSQIEAEAYKHRISKSEAARRILKINSFKTAKDMRDDTLSIGGNRVVA